LHRSPIAKIEPTSSIIGQQVLAPKVAMFSSRGPSIKYPTILKVRKLNTVTPFGIDNINVFGEVIYILPVHASYDKIQNIRI